MTRVVVVARPGPAPYGLALPRELALGAIRNAEARNVNRANETVERRVREPAGDGFAVQDNVDIRRQLARGERSAGQGLHPGARLRSLRAWGTGVCGRGPAARRSDNHGHVLFLFAPQA